MTDECLPSDVWVMAHVRRCNDNGIPAMVVRRGEAKGGAVLLKINLLTEGCRILSQARGLDGDLGWLAAFKGALVSEAEADDYLTRAAARDPDVWVIEIEDRSGHNPFEGKVF